MYQTPGPREIGTHRIAGESTGFSSAVVVLPFPAARIQVPYTLATTTIVGLSGRHERVLGNSEPGCASSMDSRDF